MIATSVGIEISGKVLRLAVLRSVLGRLRLVQSMEIPGFVDLSRDQQEASIANLIRRHKIPAGRVFLSLPRDHGVVRQIDFPVEVGEKIKSAVTLQLENLCPWPVEEIYWDFAVEAPSKGAKTFSVTVVMIPRATLDVWIDFFRLAKLPLSGASLSSVACAHAVRALWADDVPTIVLACEPAYVEASLLQAGRLTSVTDHAGETVGAAKAVLERLRAVGRIQPTDRTRAVVYGSVSSALESAGRVTIPLENAKPDSGDRFGAIAAGLLGLKKTIFASNLVPRTLRYRQNQLQLIPTYALIVLAALLGIAMVVREPYQTLSYGAELESEIQQIAPQVREVSSQEAELNQLSERYRALAAHLQARDFNLEAIRELALSLPPGAWLSNYSYQDGLVTISGFAVSASEVQKALEDTALFKEVQFTTSVTRDASGKDRFTVRAAVEVTK